MSLIRTRITARTLAFLLVAALAGGGLFAQTTSLSGTVKDPQGAVVPGSTVTLVSQAGTERTAISDDEGRYQFSQVSPGTFEIRAEQTGFKTKVIRGIRLLVDTPTTLDLELELGDISEVVTVSASSIELKNQVDSSIGNAFNENQIVKLPLESRNVVDLLSLQPGVVPDTNQAGDGRGSVAGSRGDQSNLTLDGIDVNDQQTGAAFTPVLRVTPDSVQEFRVTVSNPDASQGRSAGAQVSLVTKSGTNEFHGSLYEFHRNTVTSANDFFNNRVQGDPDLDGEPGIATPALIRNLFGGSLGGPIVKDRAFFFFNYEGRRDRSQSSALRTVPLAHLGQGEIRYENTAGQTVTLGPDDFLALYPEIGGINPVAAQVLGDAAGRYAANDNGAGDAFNTGGFRFNASTPLNQNTYTAKVDFNLSETQQLFVRGNYQWDNQAFGAGGGALLPNFPDTPAPSRWSHPYGVAAGHTWALRPNIVNTFRYGLTRQGFSSQGDSAENGITFRFIFSPLCFGSVTGGCNGRTLSRTTPVHNFTNDTSWIKGNHTLQFGTNLRFIANDRTSFASAFDTAVTNPSFYANSGGVLDTPLLNDAFPDNDFATGAREIFRSAATALIGRFTQFSANFTFAGDGSLLPSGTPTTRQFGTEEYEFYFEDTWQVVPTLTLNLGLRWGVNTPVDERTGFQVAPTVPLGDFFDQRVASSAQGIPFNDPITVDVAGPFYNRSGYYDSDYNNFMPRISAAWTPNFDSGFLRTLFGGPGQSVFRGGFAMMYDRIGSALAVSFDLNNTLGFTSSTQIAANTFNVTTNPGPLFTGFDQDIRSLPGVTTPANLVFPLQQPVDEAQRIESSLDSTLTTPVNYNWNFSIGREFGDGLFMEVGYIGRLARNLLATRDIMALNNITDPASGMDWYTAAGMLHQARLDNVPIDQLPAIAFFENLFPSLPSVGFLDPSLTATQNAFLLVARDGFDILDWTFVQLLMDDIDTPNLFFHPQYGALSAFSTVADSDYHAFTFTLRERFADSLSFDFNYTLSKSIDNASGLQTGTAFGAAFILNPLRPEDNRSLSDFDISHIINANWLWSIPVGKGRKYGSGMNGFADALLGGWQLNGIFRWNSGLPLNSPFEASRWATNWNVPSTGTRIRDPQVDPNKGGVSPNLFADPQFAYNSFRDAFPGETGDRNVLRIQGFVTFDFGLYKSFAMPYNEGHSLTFRWEVFNATNTQRLGFPLGTRDGFGLGPDPQLGTAPASFGNITAIQGEPRVMQFGLRYDF